MEFIRKLEKYNQFKNIRYQPFFNLMEIIAEGNLKSAVDIWCGTGEQTSILSEKFTDATFLGINASSIYAPNVKATPFLQTQI
ncbi:MAG: hypothetical protein V4541_04785 [Bacteroidota bacterium]